MEDGTFVLAVAILKQPPQPTQENHLAHNDPPSVSGLLSHRYANLRENRRVPPRDAHH